jgi:hypothetical protein
LKGEQFFEWHSLALFCYSPHGVQRTIAVPGGFMQRILLVEDDLLLARVVED